MRARLLAEQILLVTVVCAAIGVATLIGLHTFLFSQIDGQVHDAAGAMSHPYGHPGSGTPPNNGDTGDNPDSRNSYGQSHGPGPDFLSAPGLGGATVGVLLKAGGDLQAGVAEPADQPTATGPISQAATTTLLGVPADNRTHVVELDGLGEYLAIKTSQNDDTIVIGVSLADMNNTLTQVGWVFGSVAGGGVLLVGILGGLIIRHTLRPLRRVAATAGRVAELPLDRGEVALSVRVPDVDTDPKTEVGQVGAALNRMLGHIANALAARQASEMRVRQFVADASHELRTPLAGIRGYAELARRSTEPVPADVAHALRRVESESARMTTLVEDLLLLARLDSGRPLDREPVDLSLLVAERVGDARVAGPEHHWRLELPAEPVTVLGDGQRLHQVLANLLVNARTHTPPGSTVTTSVSVDRTGEVVLTVLDDGPGIPHELLPQVFDRFARGDTSRSRAAGSTGLGLAIVSAVVSAHRGTVTVESRPGRTAFIVRLPGMAASDTVPLDRPGSHSARTATAQQSRRSRHESWRHDRARP